MNITFDLSLVEPDALAGIAQAAAELWTADDSADLSRELAAALATEGGRQMTDPKAPPLTSFELSVDTAGAAALEAFARNLTDVVNACREHGQPFAAHLAVLLALLCAERVKSDQHRPTAH